MYCYTVLLLWVDRFLYIHIYIYSPSFINEYYAVWGYTVAIVVMLFALTDEAKSIYRWPCQCSSENSVFGVEDIKIVMKSPDYVLWDRTAAQSRRCNCSGGERCVYNESHYSFLFTNIMHFWGWCNISLKCFGSSSKLSNNSTKKKAQLPLYFFLF